jgi:hypothetical protein
MLFDLFFCFISCLCLCLCVCLCLCLCLCVICHLLRLPVVNMSSPILSPSFRYIPTSIDPAKKVQDKLLFTPSP